MFSVFSAPKYCDSTENKGAYINLGSDLKLEFVQFEAVPHPDIKPMVRLISLQIIYHFIHYTHPNRYDLGICIQFSHVNDVNIKNPNKPVSASQRVAVPVSYSCYCDCHRARFKSPPFPSYLFPFGVDVDCSTLLFSVVYLRTCIAPYSEKRRGSYARAPSSTSRQEKNGPNFFGGLRNVPSS